MAEFQEVMKQAKRMCSGNDNCDSCLVGEIIGVASCPFVQGYMCKAGEIERIVMDWAAKNPEPRYPSWKEVWNLMFPERTERLPPCTRYFVDKKRYSEMCTGSKCDECLNSPIPADIAEKLGIKPIGGVNDENA